MDSATTLGSPASSIEQKPRNNPTFNSLVKNAANEFSNLERNFFLNLTKAERKELDGNDTDVPTWYYAAHVRHHVEIMLTLKGVKPCTLIVHGDSQAIFDRMLKMCLEPVIEKYELKAYGFMLQQITHPMPTTAHPGFQNAWIFANTRSPKWSDVKNIFLTPHPGQKANEQEIGKALGYPINRRGMENTIVYKDHTEIKLLQAAVTSDARKVCCVDGMEYFCPAERRPAALLTDLEAVSKHFHGCFTAAQEVGWDLSIDFNDHPAMDALMRKMQARGGIF